MQPTGKQKHEAREEHTVCAEVEEHTVCAEGQEQRAQKEKRALASDDHPQQQGVLKDLMHHV
jgi:hypothetical protein